MTYDTIAKDRMIIISDSCSAAGCPHGEYNHLGRKVVSNSNGVFDKEEKDLFVGSNQTVNECLDNFQKITNAPKHEVV